MFWWEPILRLLLATAIGIAIGIQREFKKNSAGMRTHALVSLGACVAMLTNEYLFLKYGSSTDIARMASYVLSGIGFLGAGTIIKDGLRVRGLTTAAGLWVLASLGIAAGAGFYVLALSGTAIVVIVITVLKKIESKYMHKGNQIALSLQIKNEPGQLARALHAIGEAGALIKDVLIETECDESGWQDVTVIMAPNPVVSYEILANSLTALEGMKVKELDIE